jgi:hypothetical protein
MSPIQSGDASRSVRPEHPYRPGAGQVGLLLTPVAAAWMTSWVLGRLAL